MNILIATNHAYLEYTIVMLYSLFSNNDIDIDVYLPYTSLSADDINVLSDFVSLFSGKKLIPFQISDEFDNKVTSHNGISIETYYRILAIDSLPKELDRVLYLGVDMIIQGSILDLYNTEIGDCPFVVCEDILGKLNNFHEANKNRLGIPPQYSYFNAGVMLFNLDYLRKTRAAQAIIEHIYQNQDRYEYNDQDVLNEMYYDRLKWAPWDKYNCPPGIYMLDKESLKNNQLVFANYNELKQLAATDTSKYVDISNQLKSSASIIHFMGASKPWKSDKDSTTFSSFNEIYFKYATIALNRTGAGASDFINEKRRVISSLLADNYTYLFLKNRLEFVKKTNPATLVLGSSYGTQGILDANDNSIVNLSGPSQDIYCSYELCKVALSTLSSSGKPYPKQCVILLGYYALFDDLQKAPSSIAENFYLTYEPLIADPKNLHYDYKKEILSKFNFLTNARIFECESEIDSFISANNYFNSLYTRENNDCDYKGTWSLLSENDKVDIANNRTIKHNNLFKHKEIYDDSCKTLISFVEYLAHKEVSPIFVIPPFSEQYLARINTEYKDILFHVLDEIPLPVSLIDINDLGLFSDEDFFDSDHLNDTGAYKFTQLIKNIIG